MKQLLLGSILCASLFACTSAEGAIDVAVFQQSQFGSADAAGHVVNQLNDDTYFDFQAVHISNGLLLDSALELSAFDVVILGDDGYGQSQLGWNQMGSALKSWVNGGGRVVTTAWTVYWPSLNSDGTFTLETQQGRIDQGLLVGFDSGGACVAGR